VTSLDNGSDKKKQDVDIIDFSQLAASDSGSGIDTGVTSGADPSEWDPIAVDDEGQGRVDTCVDSGGAGAGANGPAICHTEKK
jgi:hypothetical protein